MKKMRKRMAVALMLMTVGSMALPALASETETAREETAAQAASDRETDLEDGRYTVEVTLEGGSGKASVESPAVLSVEDGQITAAIVFSSPFYDYVLSDGEKYMPVNTDGNSAFEIPVTVSDWKQPITADTIAMSTPHEIDYILDFDPATIKKAAEEAGTEAEPEEKTEKAGAEAEPEEKAEEAGAEAGPEEKTEKAGAEAEPEERTEEAGAEEKTGEKWCGLTYDHSMELQYAQQFQVDYFEGDYTRITIADGDTFLLVPEGGEVPSELESGVIVLQEPVQNIYMVATSAMDLLCSLDALDSVRLSGTAAEGWYVEAAKAAMEDGSIVYAGKYSAPDYELILSEGCGLAVESTMIYHNPEVKEKLEEFGIPVLVEHSSYEPHPMGRTEWIKMYGALLGKEEKAQEVFDAQAARVQELEASEKTDKTVAFFYISSNGYANVRKSNDYVSKMIELAGGTYIFDDLGDDENAMSTVNMTMEEFYAQAKDADCIIYNSTIDGEIYTLNELLGKSALLADFKAVKEGNVWCTGKNLFQETTGLGDMIVDIHTVLNGENVSDSELRFLHRVTAE